MEGLKKKDNNSPLKMTLTLVIICVLVAFVLSAVNKITKPMILKNQELALQNSLKTVIDAKNFEVLDNYTRVSFTLREPIKAYVNNVDEDKYELGKSNVIFNSAYAFAGVLKENEDLAFTANDTVINPKLTGLLTIGGTIDIIQQEIPEGQEYINIFSSDPEPMVFDHDVIINHIVGFKPGKTGLKFVDRYMDKLMEMI